MSAGWMIDDLRRARLEHALLFSPRVAAVYSLRQPPTAAVSVGSVEIPRTRETVVLVEMELSRIIISEINDQQVVYLREVEGERAFPILIGIFEATSINRRLTKEAPPRPLTHDLLRNTIETMGGELQDIVITRMMDHTYYAVLRVRDADGNLIEVDSRPSDAIALAVHHDPIRPIYVMEEVLQMVTRSGDDETP